jgi:hypothetical protein
MLISFSFGIVTVAYHLKTAMHLAFVSSFCIMPRAAGAVPSSCGWRGSGLEASDGMPNHG